MTERKCRDGLGEGKKWKRREGQMKIGDARIHRQIKVMVVGTGREQRF